MNSLRRFDVDFIEEYITDIQNGKNCAVVTTSENELSAKWVFDSTFHWNILNNSKSLYMCGEVWKINTDKPYFNPDTMTFFDFRGPSTGPFFYVMPYSETEASITVTQIDSVIPTLQPEYFNKALKTYIEKTLGIAKYNKLGSTVNVIPLTDYQFPRRTGSNIMTIGAKGGRVKALTGYGYTRILEDSEKIVDSLVASGQPFYDESRSPFYRMMDVFSIRAMKRKPSCIEHVFTELIAKNNGDDVLGFLDESNSLGKNIEILKKVNPLLFV
jgi:lycopene beta-cyclase